MDSFSSSSFGLNAKSTCVLHVSEVSLASVMSLKLIVNLIIELLFPETDSKPVDEEKTDREQPESQILHTVLLLLVEESLPFEILSQFVGNFAKAFQKYESF